ncbi:MAG TPA: iron ABC transporter permease [Solirubrobacteraceae bacterium]|nr:iron ABC transporter permease [Solirubrobacteraceae bacterium]
MADAGAIARRVTPRGAGLPWLLCVGFALSAATLATLEGSTPVAVWDVARTIGSHVPLLEVKPPADPLTASIVWQLRLPRVVLGGLVGAMLALAGGSYQGAFRNPLADPYLLGIAAGSGLGATLAIVYGASGSGSSLLLPLAAFAGGAVSVAIAYGLGRSAGPSAGSGALVLAGVTVASFFTAVQALVLQEHSQEIRAVYSWLLGQLDGASWRQVLIVLPYLLPSGAVLLAYGWRLDVMRVGDEEAASLGVDIRRTRLVVVLAATVGTSAAVAVSGLIGFVGIVVPHAIRMLLGAGYRMILPLSVVVGAGFLVTADTLARTVASPSELPIGVVTAMFGAPFFALVLRSTARSAR